MKISLIKFDFKRHGQLIADWHKEHVKINFPGSKYKRGKFLDILAEDKVNCDEMLLAKHKREYIGFLWLQTDFDIYKDIYYCNLKYIHVAPAFRGKGVGTYLMRKVDEYAKRNKCKEIRLGTAATNDAAICLYVSCGFDIKRVLMEKKVCYRKPKKRR